MEELGLDNILGAEDIDNLFLDDGDSADKSKEAEDPKENDKQETTEIDPEFLFNDPSESVGSETEDKSGDSEDTETLDFGASPKSNFYSSIAKALKDEGIFPDLEDEDTDSIKKPEDLVDAIEKQIQARMDERQKRVDAALGVGVDLQEIRRFENALGYLDSIKDEHISEESERGDTLRKQLIYQDFINRGYSPERAQREVNKSFSAGTDVEDAKEALIGNKEFFAALYQSVIQLHTKIEEDAKKQREEQAEKLKQSILSDSKIFGDLEVDKTTRKKIIDNLSKPVYRDPQTGKLYTAIQKYELLNREEFLKNLGLVFTLTNGFTNMEGLVKNKVKKEVRRGLRELEHTLNNTSRTGGILNFASGTTDDQSYISRGWTVDI